MGPEGSYMIESNEGDARGFADLGLPLSCAARWRASATRSPRPSSAPPSPRCSRADLLGQAATGTGKTAAFSLPLLQRIAPERKRARDATRPGARAHARAGDAGRRGHPPLRAEPGRARACPSTAASRSAGSCARSSAASTSWWPPPGARWTTSAPGHAATSARIEVVVLDEADEMLDMGFAEDIEAILAACPSSRQTALFSATMPPRIDAIAAPPPARPGAGRARQGEAALATLPWSGRSPTSCRAAYKPAALGRVLDIEAPAAAIVLLPHPRRGRPADRDAQRTRLPGRGAARRNGPAAARPGDEPAAGRHARPARGHRRRRPRARHRPAHPRRQLRRAHRAGVRMCTASAASGGPGARASPSRWPSRASSACSRPSSG